MGRVPQVARTNLSFAYGQPPSSKTESTDFIAIMLHHLRGGLLAAVIGLAITGVGGFPIVKRYGLMPADCSGQPRVTDSVGLRAKRIDTQHPISGTPCGSPQPEPVPTQR